MSPFVLLAPAMATQSRTLVSVSETDTHAGHSITWKPCPLYDKQNIFAYKKGTGFKITTVCADECQPRPLAESHLHAGSGPPTTYHTSLGLRIPRQQRHVSSLAISCALRSDPSSGLLAISAPMNPDPSLSSEEVVKALLCGLQHNDVPAKNSGKKKNNCAWLL